MPRKNKRKFFGKSKKNKSAKITRDEAASETQQHESDSEEKCGAREEEPSLARRSGKSEDTSLVVNDSAPVMGQLESVATEAHNVAVATFKEEQQNKATITLKVIQFVGEVPRETRDAGAHTPHGTASAQFNEIGDNNGAAYKSINDGPVRSSFQQSESHDVGEVPKLDHNKEKSSEANHCQRKFDDNYRVESPQQVFCESSHGPQRTKRHAMLIQEISESSSSEEMKQFLDTEASALELKVDRSENEVPKSYRIESPDSSDENKSKKVVAERSDVVVQEISESSSAESVKDEILASIAKQPPAHISDSKIICLKIINIKELPSEEQTPHQQYARVSNVKNVSPTKLVEFKSERKLNKAEEAILEALYGQKSLLQIPNLPLDAISEEGSECGSDFDKQHAEKPVNDDFDDDYFLPMPSLPKKPPSSRRRVAEPAVLINTKIIETESVPEGVNSWQTSEGDNELQAELVYLTSTSSSATDLSERNDFTDTEEPDDNSEDTDTNSMLENISVPSLDFDEHDTLLEMKILRQSPVYSTDYYQEINEQKLTDILEEDEEPGPRSLDIIESQQQIEEINKELHHLVSELEEQQPRARSRSEKSIETEATAKEEIREDEVVTQSEAKNVASENGHETSDKTIISDNDKPNVEACASPVTTRHTRKDSSDSSSNDSSSNSQCTIIRQVETIRVDPLRELCALSINKGVGNRDMNEGKITIHKKLNSSSRNAPQIPMIDELELHYECDNADLDGRENQTDRIITILQVPPEMISASSPVSENKRWFGLQSAQNPNVMVALSPMQKTYVMNSPDSNTTSADVLLDMHRKFVERRAYHEIYDTEETESIAEQSRRMNESQMESVNHLEDGYFGDRESSVENLVSTPTKAKSVDSVANCDNGRNISTSPHENSPSVKSAESDTKMNSIRNCILRDEFFRNSPLDDAVLRDLSSDAAENFDVKKLELEGEMHLLDKERRDLEEELKNLQSMQHFKREEFLFNEKKEKLQEKIQEKCQAFESSCNSRHANDFNEFVNSNEKLHQELYNEWQDKVLERYERKMQKTIKITSIIDSASQEIPLDHAASEILKFVPLENEFMSKLRERRQRLSLPAELTSSTESMHPQNEELRKFSVDETKLDSVPAHLHEFLNYYEEEIAQTKNSDESGIWSECNRSENSVDIKKSDSPTPPVWTPKSAPSSPSVERKFRPVPFESPTLQRKNRVANGGTTPPPWTQPNYPDKPYQASIIKSSSWNAISTPKPTNHIIYRKARAAENINEKVERSIQNSAAQKGNSISVKTQPPSPPVKSNELVYSIKREFNSEAKDRNIDDTRRMTSTQAPPKKIDGVGPTTQQGMPLSLRSEVNDLNRELWYKRMYNTIHKAKDDDNYVTVKYKTRRGVPYKSNGYASEPDTNYNSDYALRYNSVDRKRTTSTGNQNDEKYGSYEQPVKQNVIQYKNQPGRIEHYTPGNSSVSEKEAKQWWDDVMEIFDGHLEQQKLSSNYTQGNLSRALKDQGYQSDSTLVFKKRSDVDQLSPVEQKTAYKSVQLGGEVPLHGFRKPLPERPRVDSVVPPTPPPLPNKNSYHFNGYESDSQKRYVENDVNIHYKVPIRYEYKQPIPDDELAYQQSEHMKKVYQEERRRKYLQELQDMSSRRHTDNFTPSQKSPISLNRYDDFGLSLPSSKSPVNLPGIVAKALFSFQGQSARELSFKKGDIIYIRRQIDKNWYEGEINAMFGLLPVQYVDIISNDGTRPVATTVRKPTEGQARAKYNFVAQSDIELSLTKGELVSLTRRVDNNWFEGRIGNRKGIFPITYVDVLLNQNSQDIGSDDLENNVLTATTTTLTKHVLPSPTLLTPNSDIVRETKSIRKTEVLHVDTATEPIQYRAVFNYRPVNSDELELREGDLIYVLEQCDDGWFVGTNTRNGFFGTFPGNYVRRVY